MESSFNKHNFHGIHDPMKPRGGLREGSGGSRENAGRQLENSGGSRDNAGRQLGNSGGRRDNSGPTKDLTDEVIKLI